MTAWPTSHKSLLAVHVLRDSMELHWQRSKGLAEVRGLPGPALPAQEVAVVCSSCHRAPAQAAVLLHSHYCNKILSVGRRLSVPNYGQTLCFRVTRVVPCGSPVDVLTDRLDRASLAGEPVPAPLCKVVGATKWTVLDDTTGQDAAPRRREASLQDVGGLQSVIAEVKELMALCLGSAADTVTQGAVLLHGPAGTGKTLLAEALAAHSGAPVVRPEPCGGDTEARLRACFEAARARAPSVLLLDDLDALCPAPGVRCAEPERRAAAVLLALLDELRRVPARVVVVATTSRLEDVHPAARRPGRLDRELEVGVPSPEARLDILGVLLRGVSHRLGAEELRRLAACTHGFVGADLASLCAHAARLSLRCGRAVSGDDFAAALRLVRPSAMREVLVQVPDVRWSDIAGQHELKMKLRQAVEWPLKHPEAFSRLGISPPRGVLMFGPPGCSKTMVAKALATESQLNFLSIKGPELFSKWVGESERAVREVFRRARAAAPAVVFFDELDALGGERGAQGSGVQERVLAQLLTELDGVEPLGDVVVLGATNRPDRIDKALLRPGRLDRVMYVPLPDAQTRHDILAMQLAKTRAASDVNVEELVLKTHGYSGAEVLAVCSEAALKALEEDMGAAVVQRSHFLTALTVVTPRTPASLLQLYRDYH
ncbi:ATPase family gene 2 protein homolog A [Bacillus rossius redtenbacheri]|uniref:ATPase family gene 2 protein homolog A n=1 Tax=Bacillus rossius redtenbacheri TaxID=93214 RepID=UPI002FDE6941